MFFVCPRRTPLAQGPAVIAGWLGLALAFGTVAAASAASAVPDHIVVALDKAQLLKLPDHADTIVVGNPSIADVTTVKRGGLVVVTGKGFGETNVIFLDSTGQPLSEATITVSTATSLVTVQRGMERESYSCAPRCEPAVSLGDDAKFLQETTGQITARNGLITSGTPH